MHIHQRMDNILKCTAPSQNDGLREGHISIVSSLLFTEGCRERPNEDMDSKTSYLRKFSFRPFPFKPFEGWGEGQACERIVLSTFRLRLFRILNDDVASN